MISIYKIRIGRHGRIVLPKKLREAYRVNVGDEAVVIARGNESTMYLHNVSKNTLRNLIEFSKTVSIGLSAEELKKESR